MDGITGLNEDSRTINFTDRPNAPKLDANKEGP